MKMQTGMRVEVDVWRSYRALCSRERLRPSLIVEEFLRLVLETDSAVGFLSLLRVLLRFMQKVLMLTLGCFWIGILVGSATSMLQEKIKHL